MKLTYKHGKPHHFQIIEYPDGQQNVQLDMNYFNNVKTPVQIDCSIRNFKELEVLLCLVAALRKNDFCIIAINFIYLFGMRSDRAFEVGQPNYFRDVLAPIINNLNIGLIAILNPHSELSIFGLLVDEVQTGKIEQSTEYVNSHVCIGADQSATKAFPCRGSFIKKRNPDGMEMLLSKEAHHALLEFPDKPIMVMDDLCDGGMTFIKAAEYLEHHFPGRRRELFIVHGLFTKGLSELMKLYDKIIVSNSYQDLNWIPANKLEIIDVWSE